MRTYGLRFDVYCSILFTELALLGRPAAARAAGFEAVEFWWPFATQGYPDWIGCEYKPSDPADSSASFGWR